MKNNMSGKTAKAQRKEAEEKQAEYVARQKLFSDAIQELSRKYKIDMVAAIQYKQTALLPVIVMVDMKDSYEHMTEEAKKAEEAKKTNSQPQNPEPEKPGVPTLEV
jgi:ABC-type microcin C transport system permease subunit YejB